MQINNKTYFSYHRSRRQCTLVTILPNRIKDTCIATSVHVHTE